MQRSQPHALSTGHPPSATTSLRVAHRRPSGYGMGDIGQAKPSQNAVQDSGEASWFSYFGANVNRYVLQNYAR